jgi:ammonium transporter, Amt family
MINTANTAWMLMASILVLLMTSPGLLLFYGGMAHRKNVLSVLSLGFVLAALMSVMWVLFGWSLSYSSGGAWPSLIGGLHHAFLWGVGVHSLGSDGVPRFVLILFHMGFAIVAPALLIGGVAERMKLASIVVFMILWEILVYYPICHWVWGGGWLMQQGVLDFAGGLVVHLNVGVSALVLAIMLGRRSYLRPSAEFQSHNVSLVMTGSGLLWIGWFGFNAGSAYAVNGITGLALLNTQLGASAGALAWTVFEWRTSGKPSVVGLACGVIAGLVGVTPAAGFLGPLGALFAGALAGIFCFYLSQLKHVLRYDDSFDAFSVHGGGGLLGSLLLAPLSLAMFGGVGLHGTVGHQFMVQLLACAVVIVWSGSMTALIVWGLKHTLGIKLSDVSVLQGVDRTAYGEEGYRL